MDETHDHAPADGDELQTIGRFARRVGVTPSALRFYDDGGLLVPAEVDPTTGYRHYARAQEPRAMLIRTLRDAGLPIPRVRAVLDAEPDEARRLLLEHGAELQARSEHAAAALAAATDLLGAAITAASTITVAAPELARAIEQVVPSAGESDEVFALASVRLELDGSELHLAATDRYRLTLRSLPAVRTSGAPTFVLVAAADLAELARRIRVADLVTLTIDPGHVVAGHGHGSSPTLLPIDPGDFPDPALLLDALAPRATRLIADREALLTWLTQPAGGPTIVFEGIAGSTAVAADVAGADQRTSLPATWRGEPFRIAFTREVLAAAIEVAVGPDVMLELAAPPHPAVVRSADQGTLTTLVMPCLIPT